LNSESEPPLKETVKKEASEAKEESVENKKEEKAEFSLFGNKFGKWVLYRLFTALAWYWLALKFLHDQPYFWNST
jgi:hypothetical protein